jgi:hypothetical protein
MGSSSGGAPEARAAAARARIVALVLRGSAGQGEGASCLGNTGLCLDRLRGAGSGEGEAGLVLPVRSRLPAAAPGPDVRVLAHCWARGTVGHVSGAGAIALGGEAGVVSWVSAVGTTRSAPDAPAALVESSVVAAGAKPE